MTEPKETQMAEGAALRILTLKFGRGSNPNSRKNLAIVKKRFVVKAFSSDAFWMTISKPLSYRKASEAVRTLQAMHVRPGSYACEEVI